MELEKKGRNDRPSQELIQILDREEVHQPKTSLQIPENPKTRPQ
jgi:hypothetical protein